MAELDDDCFSCGSELEDLKCMLSQRPCGHHCNHVDDGTCHWCNTTFEEEDD